MHKSTLMTELDKDYPLFEQMDFLSCDESYEPSSSDLDSSPLNEQLHLNSPMEINSSTSFSTGTKRIRYVITPDPPPVEHVTHSPVEHVTLSTPPAEDQESELSCDNSPPPKKKKVQRPRKFQKHDTRPVQEFIDQAIEINDFYTTGLVMVHGLACYHDDTFFHWVISQKGGEFTLKKRSFFEKFDKSRRVNRVNPKNKYGPIKFLKIEKGKWDYPNDVLVLMEHLQSIYGSNVKFLTHRDWNLLPLSYFYNTR